MNKMTEVLEYLRDYGPVEDADGDAVTALKFALGWIGEKKDLAGLVNEGKQAGYMNVVRRNNSPLTYSISFVRFPENNKPSLFNLERRVKELESTIDKIMSEIGLIH